MREKVPTKNYAAKTCLIIPKARAMKVARLNETFPQAELRRLEQAECEATHRAAETPELSQARQLTWRLKDIQKPLKAAESLTNTLSL
ncbi:hypothetical protein TNCV_1344111 [Trichonephila clavipes]|nr:hypothetical protein TNCV_1344111 [Trichonephila clavipes]